MKCDCHKTTQGRGQHYPDCPVLLRGIIRAVLSQAEHLALDNARDRAQLEAMLVEALT